MEAGLRRDGGGMEAGWRRSAIAAEVGGTPIGAASLPGREARGEDRIAQRREARHGRASPWEGVAHEPNSAHCQRGLAMLRPH